MQESYEKGVANHLGPELCGVSREAGHEALVGVRAGRVYSPEITQNGVPTLSGYAEGNTLANESASWTGTPRGRRPRACTKTPRTRTGRSQVSPGDPWQAGVPVLERSGKVGRRTPLMHEPGKSDSRVVPKKVPNKARRRAAEGLEGRRLAERNSPQATTLRTQ